MTNYICEGEVLEVTAAAIIASGAVVLVGSLVGVAATNAAIGDKVAVRIKGVFSLPKVTGTAWSQGDKLYWDATAGNFTKTTTSNTFAGYAYQDAASGDATGLVKFFY